MVASSKLFNTYIFSSFGWKLLDMLFHVKFVIKMYDSSIEDMLPQSNTS